jgi:preprotein translocase subunit YajC
MDAEDLKPRDRVKLSGTGSEGVVQAVKDDTVTVKLNGDGTITTSAYQVELVESAGTRPVKKAVNNAARKKG